MRNEGLCYVFFYQHEELRYDAAYEVNHYHYVLISKLNRC